MCWQGSRPSPCAGRRPAKTARVDGAGGALGAPSGSDRLTGGLGAPGVTEPRVDAGPNARIGRA